jgi:general secretion pathway protein A
MYEAYYGLREKPFSIMPDPDLIYWGRGHRMAFAMLEFGVMNSAGFTVITGEIGSGKTTLVRHLLRRIDPRKINVGLISNTPRGREELLQWILMSLRQSFEGNVPSLIQRFQDFLYDEHVSGRRTILIIDEAQNLDPEALEGLRMLSNINVDKVQLLQLVLIGQPELKDRLCEPQLQQFAQRVSSDFHLKALNSGEVARYIDFRLNAVGGRGDLFRADACKMIETASSGIPRVINILCDTSLVYAFSLQAQQVTAEVVREVIKDKKNFGIFPSNGRMLEV